MARKSRLVLGWLAALFSTAVAAQGLIAQPASDKAGAAELRTPSGSIVYRSVFDQYVPSNEDKPVTWRDANALVGSIGGWRVYAREAQSSPAPTAPGSAPASTARPAAPASAAPPQKH